MGKKIVVMEDFTVRGTDHMKVFDILAEKYGAEVQHIHVQKNIHDGEAFAKMFLNMEKNGPDVIDEEEELLEAVCIMRSGVENVNLANCKEKGIKVINAPGRLAVPVSEFTIGLMIATMKNIAHSHQRMQAKNFDNKFANDCYSVNLKGKNVGLVGCGMVGSRVARVLKALEANVMIYDPYMPAEKIAALGYERVELNELCAKADVISIHYRLTQETKGMIGPEQFALMKPNCFLINTARAGLVDEAAMMDALENRKIAGAGLDVFHEEPLSENNPLLSMDNVTITNHLAGHCADIFQMTADIMMNALNHYFETGEWINQVRY